MMAQHGIIVEAEFEERVLRPLVEADHWDDQAIALLRSAWCQLQMASLPATEQRQAFDAACLLCGLRSDAESVAAALVADTPLFRDSPEAPSTGGSVRSSGSAADRAALGSGDNFWPPSLGELVTLVRRLRAIRWDQMGEETAESLRKMFLAMAQDVRVVLVVLALRVGKMRELVRVQSDDPKDGDPGVDGLPTSDEQAQDTLDIFAPLANRLGVWQFKWELEDAAFKLLEPELYADLARRLAETRTEREAFVRQVVTGLESKLAEAKIQARVTGRAKHIFSIHNKMRRKGVNFEQLFDVTAVRVITDDLQSCYAALGIVHSTWIPVPNEFDDYIAMPKANGYQSLHTAVMGPSGRPVEVQVRSEAMHEFAEYGVAAHWAYKEGKSSEKLTQDKFMVLRQLLDWEKELPDPEQFVQSMRTELFQDQVFVFTPNGDILDLPVGATPLDFAYRIHTMVGHRCRGAQVNEKMVPLDTALKTGDRVRILTHKQPQPSRDWLNPAFGYLKTNSARNKVRLWFRQQEREEAVQAGKDTLVRDFSRLNVPHATFELVAEALKYHSTEDLFAAVGYGDRSSQSVTSAALQIERRHVQERESMLPPSTSGSDSRATTSGLAIGGVQGVDGKRARCCNPVPGDAVIGFVTRGRGLILHRTDCVNVVECREPERLIEVEWEGAREDKYTVLLLVRAEAAPGLLAELLQLASYFGVDALSAKTTPGKKDSSADEVVFQLELRFRSAEQLSVVTQKLQQHERVLEVVRASN